MVTALPVRKIPMGRRSLTGSHHWDARALGVAFESSLERDFVTLMLLDDDIINIEEQPVKISYTRNGNATHYTPDFLITFSLRECALIEIKFEEELNNKIEELSSKFEAASNFATNKGWSFEVWTERDIRTDRLINAKFLLPYRREKRDEGIADRLLDFVHKSPRDVLFLSQVLDTCFDDEKDRGRGLRAMWWLIANGELQIDFDKKIHNNVVISLGSETQYA